VRPQRLDDLVAIVRERVAPADARGPFVGLEHAVPGQLRLGPPGDASSMRGRGQRFLEGDLLFAALRPSLRKVVRAPFAGVCSAEWLVLRPRPGRRAGLAFAVLADPTTLAFARQRATGTQMPRVGWEALRGLPLPPIGDDATAAVDRLALLFEARIRALYDAQDRRAALIAGLVARDGGRGGPRVGDVATLRRVGLTPAHRVPPGAPVFGGADLPTVGLAVDARPSSQAGSRKRRVFFGDVLVSLLRPDLHEIGLCPADGFASTEIGALEPAAGWRGALAGGLRAPAVRARWIGAATGTRMPRLAPSALLDTPVGVHPDEIGRLRPALEAAADAILLDAARAAALRESRDRILADLLAGRARPKRA
jgi:hypothetical protein